MSCIYCFSKVLCCTFETFINSSTHTWHWNCCNYGGFFGRFFSTYWFDGTFSGTWRSKTTRTLLLFSFKERHAFNASIPMNVNTLCLWNCFINKKFLSWIDTWGCSRLKQLSHPITCLWQVEKARGPSVVLSLSWEWSVESQLMSCHRRTMMPWSWNHAYTRR